MSHVGNTREEKALIKVGILAQEYCRQDLMGNIVASLCDLDLVAPEDMVACVQANMGVQGADNCVDDSVHLGALCASVCHHTTQFSRRLKQCGALGTSVLTVLVVIRSLKIMQQCFAAFSHHSVSTSGSAMLGRELGFDDNFDTDSE